MSEQRKQSEQQVATFDELKWGDSPVPLQDNGGIPQNEQPDDREPSPQRQAELEAAYATNIAAGRPPYDRVRIHTRGELRWIMRARQWSGEDDNFTVKYLLRPQEQEVEAANLNGAWLADSNLSDIQLRRATFVGANLVRANLCGADLVDTDFARADLGFANLQGTNLIWSNFDGAHLRQANLQDALLRFANLSGAGLARADLQGADLRNARLDATTLLAENAMDARTQLRDVVWNGAMLTRLNWNHLRRLGDEALAEQSKTPSGKNKTADQRLAGYQGAVRGYEQLAVVLQGQGLTDPANRFAYRAQVLQRQVLKRQGVKKWPAYVGSFLLATLAGYGYRLWRILVVYVLALLFFAACYYFSGVLSLPGSVQLQWYQSLLVSLTAIHGRVFFETFGLNSSESWIAAIESVVGIIIEGVFVAMLIQRFFRN
jgi:uncharacterized protein YjbI with pentapeptide repeats